MSEINEKEIKRRLEAISSFKTTPEAAARDLERVRKMLTSEQATRQANIWRIIMKSRIIKLAAAAVIIIAVLIGINQFGGSTNEIEVAKLVHGPQRQSFNDGSTVKLAEGAEIRLYNNSEKRGFEHLAGEIEVTVTKGKGKFVVATSFGDVKALGTVFEIDLVNTNSIDILAVEVKEGLVEVSNPQGSKVIKANQGVTVERDKAPYDFRQDENLPQRLVERIQSMLDAFEAGDAKAWARNFNIKSMYDLAKGKIKFSEHKDWFSGMSPDDAKRFIEICKDVNSPEELFERFVQGVNVSGPRKVYIGSVSVNADGKHAIARCVRKKGDNRYVIYTPQWTFFDGDWWQTDD